jgi:hypothetical protein
MDSFSALFAASIALVRGHTLRRQLRDGRYLVARTAAWDCVLTLDGEELARGDGYRVASAFTALAGDRGALVAAFQELRFESLELAQDVALWGRAATEESVTPLVDAALAAHEVLTAIARTRAGAVHELWAEPEEEAEERAA